MTKTEQIAELEALMANAIKMRKQARKLNLRSLITNLNHDIRNWNHELATLKAGA